MAHGDEPQHKPFVKVQSNAHVKAFFLDLAAKGKDAWNAWRREPANEYVRVTFAGIDFREAPRDGIDFSGFEFGDFANFSWCKWRGAELEIPEDPKAFKPGLACFTGAAFGNGANFAGAVFGDRASFLKACFEAEAKFTGAAFGRWAVFTGAVFGDGASFVGEVDPVTAAFGKKANFTRAAFGKEANFALATFGIWANFARAAFGNGANFAGAAFGDRARFTGAAFGDVARFDETFFKGRVNFTGKSIEQWTRDPEASADEEGEKASVAPENRHRGSWTRYGSGPDRFLTILFTHARFDGEADFSGRTFERAADFTNARFYYPPDFDAATNAFRIDFTGAQIGFVPPGKRPWTKHWTTNSQIPLRLRAFRKIAEETKNHDLERDLYIEERKAERGIYLGQLLELDELKKNLEELNNYRLAPVGSCS